MQKLHLSLNENHIRKAVNGHPIQLSKDHLNGSEHFLVLHPENYKKCVTAKAKGRGVRITLTHPELAASGEGFMDILRKIKDGASWFKSKVLDSNFYQQNIKPEVRALVDAGTAAVSPMLPAPVANVAKSIVNAIGDKTGAYGLIDTTIKPKKITKKQVDKMIVDFEKKPKKVVKSKKSASGSFNIV